MTTYLDALSNFDHPSDEIKAFVAMAVEDPILAVWPEVTQRDHTIVRVAATLTEAVELLCSDDKGDIDAYLATAALNAVLAGMNENAPAEFDLAEVATAGIQAATTVRDKVAAYDAAAIGAHIGTAVIEGVSVKFIKTHDRQEGSSDDSSQNTH